MRSKQSAQIAIGPINLHGAYSFEGDNPVNPGIGGTEFQTIRLATILGQAGYTVDLICNGREVSSTAFSCVSMSDATNRFYDLLITTVAELDNRTPEVLMSEKILVISHHPHDITYKRKTQLNGCDLLVSVGQYQYWSNGKSPITHIWIPGFSLPPLDKRAGLPESPLVVGHVSSLHPSKGFLVLAKAWKRVKRLVPDARLEVAGGINLYGKSREDIDEVIPASINYAKKIRKAFGGNVPPEVSFLGVQKGEELAKTIAKWGVAVLNPLGTGEADPGVVNDCWRQGVPVISTMRYGMGDYMLSFPELVANNPRQVARRITEISNNHEKLSTLSSRALSNSRLLLERSHQSRLAWLGVVSNVLGTAQKPHLQARGLNPRLMKFADHVRLIRGTALSFLYRVWSSAKSVIS